MHSLQSSLRIFYRSDHCEEAIGFPRLVWLAYGSLYYRALRRVSELITLKLLCRMLICTFEFQFDKRENSSLVLAVEVSEYFMALQCPRNRLFSERGPLNLRKKRPLRRAKPVSRKRKRRIRISKMYKKRISKMIFGNYWSIKTLLSISSCLFIPI